MQDYNQAELKGFQDFCALLIARGMTKRVVKDYHGALTDFQSALEHMDKADKVGTLFELHYFELLFKGIHLLRVGKFRKNSFFSGSLQH